MQSTSGRWKEWLNVACPASASTRLTQPGGRCQIAAFMLPREFLRENAERLLAEFPERYSGSGLDRFVEVDRLRRETVTELEQKRPRRNETAAAKGKPSPEALIEMKTLKEEIRRLESEVEQHEVQ